MRNLQKLSFALAVSAGAIFAQAPSAAPEFEVASIKVAPPIQDQLAAGKLHVGVKIDAARVDMGSVGVPALIAYAYGVKLYQISGMPLASGERFDIMAKIPDGATRDQVPQMMQALLADRFKLKLHRESKEEPVYALVVAKGGPRLNESLPEAEQPVPAAASPGTTVLSVGNDQMKITPTDNGATISSSASGTVKMSRGSDGTMRMEIAKTTLEAFAEMLIPFMDRPVIDMTELKGNYQIALDLSMADLMKTARNMGVNVPAQMPMRTSMATPMPAPGGAAALGSPADAASDPSGGAIFQSVQKLGLRLESRKAPIEILVIEHAEKLPTEN